MVGIPSHRCIAARRLAPLLAAAVLALPCATIRAEDILIYASDYTASHDISLAPIEVNLLGWLTGLDYPGEWVQYSFTASEFGTNRTQLAVRGAENVPYHLTLSFVADGSGTEQTMTFDFIGAGFGDCSCNILLVSSVDLGVWEPSYTVLLSTTSTGDLWVYSLQLPVETGNDSAAWGSIKSLYRHR